VYVAPSRYEPFGLAPREAARAGCALVLSRIGSFEELWDGCAEFFPAGDDHRLAEILDRLSGDPARTLALAEVAQARALEAFTVERFGRDYLDLYRRTVGGATAAPSLAPPLLER
jgi:glycosyltransferase involved in cell wall biosynthesis